MGLELLLSSWLLCCGPSQLGADWAHLLSQVTLSRSAHLWPAAQAPSGARGCPWASGGWGFTAGEHRVRGLSQASPSNVKAIKATSSVRSRRASGSGAAATTHLTSPPTAPSLPQCGCAPGWTFSSSGGQDLHLCILVAGASSGHLCQLKISSSFFFPTLPGTHHTGLGNSSPRKTQDRTLVSGQDGGPVAACSPTLVGPSKHLLRGLQHMGEGNQGGIQRGVVYISKTLWLVLGGG